MAVLGVLCVLAMIGLGIAQIYLGTLGIHYHFGYFWASVAIFVGIVMRIGLPFSIGAYFGAVDVMGWPWYVGVALMVPGLLLIFPAIVVEFCRNLFNGTPPLFKSKREEDETIIDHDETK